MSKNSSKIVKRKIVSSIQFLDEDLWNTITQNENIYLSYSYLSALEDTIKEEIDFYYSISFDDQNNPVLVASFQVVHFSDKKKRKNSFHDTYCLIKNKILSFNILVCGNVFSDGENGFLFADSVSKKEAIIELSSITEKIKAISKKNKKKLPVVLFKEFWAKEDTYTKSFKKQSFREFMIDVNMVLPIHESWNNLDDYLFSLKTKYRTRAKSVYKKSKELVFRNLNKEEIEEYNSEIKTLFNNVVDNATFSLGALNSMAFVKFKEALNEQFIFKAAFLEDKMVGFCTSFFHNNILEANYVGIDYELNHDKSIYQRLLYEYVETALELNAKELQLGRTSELIKSAIGAVPENMKLYAKHRSTIPNLLLKPAFHFISPSKFELRQPFKTEYAL
ncbi:hypothetical protein OAD28_05365 [Flavobacteriales bacterium]|nr:hypothetical protein [Flavobacteriales bacterium]